VFVTIVLGVILIAVGLLGFAGEAWAGDPGLDEDVFRAQVLAVERVETEEAFAPGFALEKQLLTVEVTSGPFKGQMLNLEDAHTGHPAYDLHIEPGDKVLVWAEVVNGEIVNAYLSDYARDQHLVYLVGGFVLALVVIGGLKGVKAVFTLGITGLAIGGIMLPLMLKGHSPIILAVLVSAAVVVVTFVVIGGLGVKTLAAAIGTIGGVIVAGVMALLVGTGAQLTGFGGEDATALLYIPQEIDFDFQGLLFAGMIIGALGAVMDVGMSVASAMDEVKKANPAIKPLGLFRAGMNVGRDIMGTMANTLILAYAGAAIPLLLVFMAYDTPFLKIINLDLIATEVVRALAGSIGLILCVPLTAFTAALLLSRESRVPGVFRN
jgi:uncharacterized membrane protein